LSSLKEFVARQEAPVATVRRAILMVLTSHEMMGDTGNKTGWCLPEAAHAHSVFTSHGYTNIYASPKGGVAPLDPASIAAGVSDAISMYFYKIEDNLGLTKATIPIGSVKSSDFDCVFYVGGAGALWDFPDCEESRALAAEIYESKGDFTPSRVEFTRRAPIYPITHDNKHAYAGQLNSFTHLRALFGTPCPRHVQVN
jgi:hypothetical protein